MDENTHFSIAECDIIHCSNFSNIYGHQTCEMWLTELSMRRSCEAWMSSICSTLLASVLMR